MDKSLIDEVPEAKEFCDSVVASVDERKLFDGEEFADLKFAVLSTTGVDSQREVVPLGELEKMAAEINCHSLGSWIGADHDPLIQTTGRIIAAKVFHEPHRDMHFSAAVIGIYDAAKAKSFRDVGVDLTAIQSESAVEPVARGMGRVQLAFSPYEFSSREVDTLLADAPEPIDRRPVRSVRKALDPLVILGILVTLDFLASFRKRLAENAADAVTAWFSRMFEAIKRSPKPRVLLVYYTEHHGCQIQFVCDSKDPAVLSDAWDSIDQAAASALAVLDKLRDAEIVKLVYAFDTQQRRWMARHATAHQLGVICDEPTDVDFGSRMSMSFGGTAEVKKPGES